MHAFHINWTAPFLVRNPEAPYAVEPFELLTTMLSALIWRTNNGSISMETDACGAAYYNSIGLSSLWDGGVHPSLEGIIPPSVSPLIFWAAGKLYALRQMKTPCVMLDTDFIVWKDIMPLLEGSEISVIHREDIDPAIYPDPSCFHVSEPLALSAAALAARPCNTALAYFANDAFRLRYTNRAISFMERAPNADNALTYMVFAEQRLLAICAEEEGIAVRSLSDLPELFLSQQQLFTHVWGHKQQLRTDPAAYEKFCRRCAARLIADFPYFAERAACIPSLHPYFEA